MMNTVTFHSENKKAHSMAQRLLSSVSWLGCVAMLFALMCAGSAKAQLSGKGAITGTVTDKSGAVIPGAEIAATNGATNFTVTTKTGAAGNYTFANLDPGIYTVTITAQGFAKLAQQNIHVNAMESQAYDPVLTVSSTNEVITVTAEPPQLETSNATLGTTMEQETYAELPIEMGAYGSPDQRRATDFVYLMPGVQGNETNGNATTNTGVVNGSGSRGAVSNVYIDGVPFVRAGGNGDPRYVWTAISVDAVDQFQLQTSGYSAIYEGQGVMNYSIKQGGTKYHAAVYEFFRNTALDTWGFFKVFKAGSTTQLVKPVEHSNEYGINLGGPLIPFGGLKDKLYFAIRAATRRRCACRLTKRRREISVRTESISSTRAQKRRVLRRTQPVWASLAGISTLATWFHQASFLPWRLSCNPCYRVSQVRRLATTIRPRTIPAL